MRRTVGVLLLGALAGLAGCQRDIWFEGSLEQGLAAAGQRQTLVMVEFFTDW